MGFYSKFIFPRFYDQLADKPHWIKHRKEQLASAEGEVLEIGVSHRRRWSGRSKYGAWSRLWVGIRDAFGVRWLLRRRLVYRTRENRRGEKG